jgi:uncharacterized protein YoxC
MWDWYHKTRWQRRIEQKVDWIMATLEDLQAVLDGIAPKVSAVKADTESLLAKLAAIPTSGLTPEQQAAIDGAVAKAQAISDSLTALDNAVPSA